jgi:hypothetical protein
VFAVARVQTYQRFDKQSNTTQFCCVELHVLRDVNNDTQKQHRVFVHRQTVGTANLTPVREDKGCRLCDAIDIAEALFAAVCDDEVKAGFVKV